MKNLTSGVGVVMFWCLASNVWSLRTSIPIPTWLRSGTNWLGRLGVSGAPAVNSAQASARPDLPPDLFHDPDDRNVFRKQLVESEDTFLADLASAEVMEPPPDDVVGITKIRIARSPQYEKPFSCRISPNILFKRHFVNDLLSNISWNIESSIIIGSSGTSKSVFQFVLLHHLLTNSTGKLSLEFCWQHAYSIVV
jgi:hypothetical protein